MASLSLGRRFFSRSHSDVCWVYEQLLFSVWLRLAVVERSLGRLAARILLPRHKVRKQQLRRVLGQSPLPSFHIEWAKMNFYGRWVELDALRAWRLAQEIHQRHLVRPFLARSSP